MAVGVRVIDVGDECNLTRLVNARTRVGASDRIRTIRNCVSVAGNLRQCAARPFEGSVNIN